MLLSVMIEYFSLQDIKTYYVQLNPIIESYLQSSEANLKRLAVITVNNLTQTGNAIKVLKEYPNLIPLVLNAIDIEQEDLIQTIFETFTEFFETPKVIKPHLTMLVEAACNISQNANLSFNVRSTTIFFLEEIGMTLASFLVKKHPQLLEKVIQTGFTIACEDTEEYGEGEETPHMLALEMLYSFASEVPNEVVYPIFQKNVRICFQKDEPLVRKAGLRILGHVSDSEALLDFIKDDVEEYTGNIVSGFAHPSQIVREATCDVVGAFSENVIPDFLFQHKQVMPALLKALRDQVTIAATSEDHAQSATSALTALSEFAANMEEYEMGFYLKEAVEISLQYLVTENQKRKVQYQALTALSSIIIAADRLIVPYMNQLLEPFYNIVKNSTQLQDQPHKGQALMCAGNLAQACGKEHFPQQALEEFTKFAIECLQQSDARFELRETALNYFSEISKIMKS